MRDLPIDLGEITMAMEDHGGFTEWYLDLLTGAVIPTSDDEFFEEDEVEEDFDAPESLRALHDFLRNGDGPSADRFEPIPLIESHRVFDRMLVFAASVQDDGLRTQLGEALDGRGAFRRFRNALREHPEELERWYRVRDDFLSASAREWLESIGIRAVPRPIN